VRFALGSGSFEGVTAVALKYQVRELFRLAESLGDDLTAMAARELKISMAAVQRCIPAAGCRRQHGTGIGWRLS